MEFHGMCVYSCMIEEQRYWWQIKRRSIGHPLMRALWQRRAKTKMKMLCIITSCNRVHMVNNLWLLCSISKYAYIAALQSLKQLLDSRLRSAGVVSGRCVHKTRIDGAALSSPLHMPWPVHVKRNNYHTLIQWTQVYIVSLVIRIAMLVPASFCGSHIVEWCKEW